VSVVLDRRQRLSYLFFIVGKDPSVPITCTSSGMHYNGHKICQSEADVRESEAMVCWLSIGYRYDVR
jgi:hypothetical protein